jgi:hypothetical protein
MTECKIKGAGPGGIGGLTNLCMLLGKTSSSNSGRYKFVNHCNINLQKKKIAWFPGSENICNVPSNSTCV